MTWMVRMHACCCRLQWTPNFGNKCLKRAEQAMCTQTLTGWVNDNLA